MFAGADRRQAKVEFFLNNEAKDARDWLKSDNNI